MRFRAVLAIGLVVFLFSACAKDRLADRRARYQSEAERQRFSMEHNLGHLPPSDIPLELNDRVYAWMDYFQGVGRNHFQRYLERSGRYNKMMRDILKQNGLPQDLIYVAMIESGFNNNAYSRAHAVGPWQFIRGTGSRYGLEIGRWVDERRDPVKATWAAARYLRDLYNEFGDWYLAMAAYNAGEGRIRDAVADSGSRRYWDIADANERYLRAETRDYIPKYLAAAIMAKMPQSFGFTNIQYQGPLEFDVADVETQTDLEVIADCAGVNSGTIADLNPHLVRGSTPPGARNYQINLPKGTVANFKAKYAALPESERVKIVYHKVRRGETTTSIARRYGISRSALMAANDISAKHRLRAGKVLVIPRGSAGSYAKSGSYDDDTERVVRSKKLVKYRVKKMDSVSKIAARYGVTAGQIKSWNAITKRNPLRVGRLIKIYQPVYAKAKKSKQIAMADVTGGAQHKIQAGETLWAIAQRYGMSVDDLASMNGLDKSEKIKPGQKVIVRQEQGKTMLEAKQAPQEEAVEKDEGKDTSIAMVAASEASPDDIDLSLKDPLSEVSEKKVTATKKYKVKKGDSLNAIARKHGVSVSDLIKWNDIKNPKMIRAGQVLKIKTTEVRSQKPKVVETKVPEKIEMPAAIPVPEKEEGTPLKLTDIPLPATQSSLNYKVKDGDTLWDIARRHKVTIAEIQKWNNLSDPSAVKPGTSLTIHSK